jgi:hypothetical protein
MKQENRRDKANSATCSVRDILPDSNRSDRSIKGDTRMVPFRRGRVVQGQQDDSSGSTSRAAPGRRAVV